MRRRADADEAGELEKLEPDRAADRLGKPGVSAPGFDVAGTDREGQQKGRIRSVRHAVEERPQFAPAP
jgi:hypothetical protein